MFVTRMSTYTNSTAPAYIQKDTRWGARVMLMIPTLNEEEAIGSLIVEAHATGFSNVVVIDGFSSDQTRTAAEQADAEVILQDFGKGKGCGVRTGMKVFIDSDAELLCMIDGDGTNVPSFLSSMVTLATSGHADVVLGSRTRGPREQGAMSLLSLASNLTVSFLLSLKFGRLFTDIQTGYWVFTREAVERLYESIHSTGFEIELELFVKIIKQRLRVCEVPVGFRLRKGSTKFSFMFRMRNLYYAFKFLVS
jgi:glycosyltransferase involved in cell wall biosynthesis